MNLIGLDLTTDPNGLPIHGTLWDEAWEVVALSSRGGIARLRMRFEYTRPDLLAAFPFPHHIEMAIRNDGRSIAISTSVSPIGDRPVPVSFGFHPYLRLPCGPRSSWRLVLPRRRHLALDSRMIPTGRSADEPAESDPIRRRTFDDGYELTDGTTLRIEGGGHRLSVRFGAGYPYAQVFAPPGTGFVCLEPMTAPTNALANGTCPIVEPDGSFTARFSIRPERTA